MSAKGKESSDEMIDIQIEESLVRESLMKIDTVNFKEDILLIGFFAFLLIGSTIASLFLSSTVDSEKMSKELLPSAIFDFEVSSLTSVNRFASIYLSFNRSVFSSQKQFYFSVTYEVKCYKKNNLVHTTNNKVDRQEIDINEFSFESLPIGLYEDNIIDYDSLKAGIRIVPEDSANLSHAIITITKGNPNHSLVQAAIRYFYIMFMFVMLIVLIIRLKYTPVRLWHLEQKMTIPLLVITILYDNPLYGLEIASPSYTFLILDCIIQSLFTAYFRFFILVLFDSLRYKNRKTDSCFFIPKIAFTLVMFIVSLIHNVFRMITSFDTSPINNISTTERILGLTELILLLLFLVWFALSVIFAGFQVDITERYKFNMYVCVSATALLILAIMSFLYFFLGFLRNAAITFVETFTIQNLFVIIITYFHWPYEVIDSAYEETKKNESNEFVSENTQNSLEGVAPDL